MKNPNFFFIKAAQNEFAKMGAIELKTTRSDEEKQHKEQRYYMITPAQCFEEPFLINGNPEKLANQHISVYEHQSKREASKLASTHVTLAFTHSERMHFYFDRYGNYLSNDLAKTATEIISFEPQLMNIAISYAGQFYSIANSVHQRYKQQFDKHYQPKLEALNQLHIKHEKVAHHYKLSETLNNIEQSTSDIITYLKQYQSVLLETHDHIIAFFSKYLNEIKQQKILQEKTDIRKKDREEKVSSEEISAATVRKKNDEKKILSHTSKEKHTDPKKAAINNRISTIKQAIKNLNKPTTVSNKATKGKGKKQQISAQIALSSAAKLVKKYSLYSELFKISSNDDDILNSIIQQRQLAKKARTELNTIIKNKSSYALSLKNEYKKNTLIPLLQMIDLNLEDFGKALSSHCYDLLLLIRQVAPNLNLNLNIPSHQLTPLQLTYQRNDWRGFSLLLKDLHCSPGCINKTGHTLLQKSCIDRKESAIRLLLQHGASITRYSYEGYTAFGYLTFNSTQKPDMKIVKMVIEHTLLPTFLLDLMQGPINMRGTPLAYACQQGWNQIAKFYLQSGADPKAARESDLLSPIEIVVYKNNIELFDYLLANHANSIVEIFQQTLKLAKNLGRNECLTRLNTFAEKYHDDIEKIDTDVSYTLQPGASLGTILKLI